VKFLAQLVRLTVVRSLPQLLLGLAATAIALVITGVVVADAVRDVKRARDTIAVTGSAKQPITADLVKWTLSVSVQDREPAAASRLLRSHAGQVRAFLRRELPVDALSEPPVSTEQVEQTLPGRRRVTAYRLTQSFAVSTKQIDKAEAAAARVSELLEAGVPVSALPLEYISTQLTRARLQALERATEDARTRAERIVKGIGGELGGARSAELGVYQVTPRNSTEVSDYGINDTTTRDKDVTAVVTLTFALAD
jgi:uncharacterized protein